jgi:cation diffusion facilitator CzcD-associated flavoprotein CzcO
MSGLPFSHHVKEWMTHRPFLDLYKKNTNTNDMSFRTIKNTSYVGVLFDDRRGRWKIKIESFFLFKNSFQVIFT